MHGAPEAALISTPPVDVVAPQSPLSDAAHAGQTRGRSAAHDSAHARQPAPRHRHGAHRSQGRLDAARVALSALSMFMASQMQRHILRLGGVAVSARRFLAVCLASNALAVTVPVAGSTAGTAFTGTPSATVRMLRSAVGSSPSRASCPPPCSPRCSAWCAVDGGIVHALLSVAAVMIGVTPPVLIVLALRSNDCGAGWSAGSTRCAVAGRQRVAVRR